MSNFGAGVGAVGVILLWIGLLVGTVGAWVTHIFWLIGKLASDGGATVGQIALGLIGIFTGIIGVIHGWMIWFGAGLG